MIFLGISSAPNDSRQLLQIIDCWIVAKENVKNAVDKSLTKSFLLCYMEKGFSRSKAELDIFLNILGFLFEQNLSM